jgi:hypothetical protein
MLAPMGLIPIEETAENDVFIVGFPKSGHTWLQALTAALVFGVDIEHCPDTVVQDLVPDVHVRQFYRRYREAAYFKSHHLPSPRYKRVVYLIRDGRDVMVSYWHYLRAMGAACESTRELVESPNHYFLARWQDHIERWMENPYQADILQLRYEKLRTDPAPHVCRFAEFLGVKADDERIRRAVRQCSFERMKSREARLGWEDKNWPADKPFVRRGQVGSHRDEMDADALDSFENQAGHLLQALGYAPASESSRPR